MALVFPNSSRSYDPALHRVRFWGYDGVTQVPFFLESDALARIDPKVPRDELVVLGIFDKNIDRILDAAAKAYRRSRRNSYQLIAADF
jgi:hypothetical protein